MDTLTIVGCQFGDEGKGKIIDYLSKGYDLNVRFNGGENAGHTVVVGDQKIKYHLVPSGFLNSRTSVIANGVVVNIKKLAEEINFLRGLRNQFDLRISSIAHVVTDLHIRRDEYLEQERGRKLIGTTHKGIGPTYESKFGRYGLRLIDLNDPDKAWEMLKFTSKVYNTDIDRMQLDLLEAQFREIKKYLCDTPSYLKDQIDEGRNALFETAQGTFLDIEFGTYPFVTSSHTTAEGVTVGTGLPPKYFNKFIGVAKAYTTRVGEGIFPTELQGSEGEKLRTLGNEFGATTGRPRRVGYLDIPMLRKAVKINSLDYIALTKADILGKMNTVKVAVSYESSGSEVKEFSPDLQIDKINYEDFPSWKDNEQNLETYISFIEDELKVPINLVGCGERRKDTIERIPLS